MDPQNRRLEMEMIVNALRTIQEGGWPQDELDVLEDLWEEAGVFDAGTLRFVKKIRGEGNHAFVYKMLWMRAFDKTEEGNNDSVYRWLRQRFTLSLSPGAKPPVDAHPRQLEPESEIVDVNDSLVYFDVKEGLCFKTGINWAVDFPANDTTYVVHKMRFTPDEVERMARGGVVELTDEELFAREPKAYPTNS